MLTRIEPRMATQYASAAENARPFFQYVADVTVQKMTMTAPHTYRASFSVWHCQHMHQARTFDGAVNGTEEGGLPHVETKARDDDLALVAQLRAGNAIHLVGCWSCDVACTHRVCHVSIRAEIRSALALDRERG